MMNTNKYNPAAIRQAFKFLVDEFGYTIIRDEELFHADRRYAFVIEYSGNDRRIRLSHDYKENFFYFVVIKGRDTKYPNESDNENVTIFWKLFRSFEPSIGLQELQPNGQTCSEAAIVNAQLLRRYAPSVLRGETWI
jgi:hypothetical protein